MKQRLRKNKGIVDLLAVALILVGAWAFACLAFDDPRARATFIGAIVAIGTYYLTHQRQREMDRHKQFRDLVSTSALELAEALDELLSCASVAIRRDSKGQDPKKWLKTSEEAGGRIKRVVRRMRVLLPELAEPLKYLTLMPVWASWRGAGDHWRENALRLGSALSREVEKRLSIAVLEGRAPTESELSDLANTMRKLEDHINNNEKARHRRDTGLDELLIQWSYTAGASDAENKLLAGNKLANSKQPKNILKTSIKSLPLSGHEHDIIT